ncbi:MAG: hypothetical protein HY378_01675 [Candidatus Brennerbacteria bacterium]|nr:hypothetical protein [Candidatus Brennerbacteria bacterium]
MEPELEEPMPIFSSVVLAYAFAFLFAAAAGATIKDELSRPNDHRPTLLQLATLTLLLLAIISFEVARAEMIEKVESWPAPTSFAPNRPSAPAEAGFSFLYKTRKPDFIEKAEKPDSAMKPTFLIFDQLSVAKRTS